jgi:hypothetical protein
VGLVFVPALDKLRDFSGYQTIDTGIPLRGLTTQLVIQSP